MRDINYKFLLFCLAFLLSFKFSINAQPVTIETGINLIKNDKLNEAKAFFKSLKNSSSAQANFYLGQIYFLEEKYDSSKLFYEAGIKSDPEFPLNYAGLVKIFSVQNNTAQKDINYENALEYGEKDFQTYIILAEAYSNQKMKDYNLSVELLNTAIKLNSGSIDAYLALGKIQFEKGDGTEAIKSFQRAIDLDPKNPEALTSKARIYILIDNSKEAFSLLNDAVKFDPAYPSAWYELAELSANLKDYEKAAEYYEKYINTSEPGIEKNKRYASILYLAKEYQKAIDLLKEIYNADPGNAVPLRILAYSYLKLEDYQNSALYFQKLFEISGAQFQASDYENYADLLSKNGDDSLAIIYLSKIMDLDSSRQDILSKISVLNFKNKNWSGVISTLQKKNKLSAQELFDLGKAYYFSKDSVMADTTFARLIETVPTLAIAYHWRARINSMFDPESEQGMAKPYYEKFISLAENEPDKFKKELIEAYSYLGYYFYLKEEKNYSKNYWEKVAQIDPENVQAKAALNELK